MNQVDASTGMFDVCQSGGFRTDDSFAPRSGPKRLALRNNLLGTNSAVLCSDGYGLFE
ncbi:MAG: hypothetical protein M2R46_03404 [Verrucomicrobia subdivision 3 bacterium]|nr:hypothetical protein [Limisphaerales bacterium]